MSRPAAVLLTVAAAIVGVLALVASAAAQSQVSGPTVVPDRYELRPGERVKLTLDGFQARGVTMVFCGNDGRRGSVDCNMRAGQGREINQDGTPTPAEMEVATPPVPCPCIIRVSSQDTREVAVAAITLVGHPVADVEGGAEFVQAIAVGIEASPAPSGFGDSVRSSLGGPTTYDVTVEVRNQATFVVDNVRATANYHRLRADDIRNIELEAPGTLQPGEIWTQTVQVEVPSLTFGDVEWRVDASGTGPSVTSTDTTSQQPVLLYVTGLLLLADVLYLLWRMIRRRRRRRRRRPRPAAETEPDDLPEVPAADELWAATQPSRPPSTDDAITDEVAVVGDIDRREQLVG